MLSGTPYRERIRRLAAEKVDGPALSHLEKDVFRDEIRYMPAVSQYLGDWLRDRFSPGQDPAAWQLNPFC